MSGGSSILDGSDSLLHVHADLDWLVATKIRELVRGTSEEVLYMLLNVPEAAAARIEPPGLIHFVVIYNPSSQLADFSRSLRQQLMWPRIGDCTVGRRRVWWRGCIHRVACKAFLLFCTKGRVFRRTGVVR
jgi:hypothetical protein